MTINLLYDYMVILKLILVTYIMEFLFIFNIYIEICFLNLYNKILDYIPFIDVNTTVFEDIALAKPKSHNFTTPLALIKIFYGFISL
jgi:hypothetical protein